MSFDYDQQEQEQDSMSAALEAMFDETKLLKQKAEIADKLAEALRELRDYYQTDTGLPACAANAALAAYEQEVGK